MAKAPAKTGISKPTAGSKLAFAAAMLENPSAREDCRGSTAAVPGNPSAREDCRGSTLGARYESAGRRWNCSKAQKWGTYQYRRCFAARIVPRRFIVSRPALLMRFGVCFKAARQRPSFKTVRPLTGMVREDKELQTKNHDDS